MPISFSTVTTKNEPMHTFLNWTPPRAAKTSSRLIRSKLRLLHPICYATRCRYVSAMLPQFFYERMQLIQQPVGTARSCSPFVDSLLFDVRYFTEMVEPPHKATTALYGPTTGDKA
ncbi:hypothetical protein AVEN_140089-1 [Araneus ventricosus]|uniref:Uncharacterized protein n=1 Tax=Araneus ventricosus TaxID=182803 RepID=A0A4Y2QSF0_ARAVE|nr:hypothetical protein AVEN_140089-1 [Araneus ventricosus]